MRRWAVLVLVVVLGVATISGGQLVGAQDRVEDAAQCESGLCGSGPSAPEYVPDELLVRFRPAVGKARAAQVVSAEGAEHARGIPALGVQVLRLPPGLSVEEAVVRFSRRPEVEYAEPNYILHIAQVGDPCLEQWGPQAIDAPQAWLTTKGSPDTIIAVTDTGIDYRHSELAPNIWTNDGEIEDNDVDDDGNGYVDDVKGWDFINGDADPLDDHDPGHGTHVAGIAAAIENGNPDGVVGICPSCTLMPVKVLDSNGSGGLDVVANGITYAADNGAKVINLSLAGPMGMATLESAVNYAWDQGVVVVAAAGNDGAETEVYPAAYANAIAVAATNEDDHKSCFSNYGSGYIDVAAPGEFIYSTLAQDENGDNYGCGSGTSMAAPHVSGLAGLLFSYNDAWDMGDVRTLIETTTEDLGPEGADAYFGTGRINAARALAEDISATTPPAGLFSDSQTASGYPHTRKLARDADGTLHLAWHSSQGGNYQVLYATSGDNGVTWTDPELVFSSTAETYHPALALDNDFVYFAFPSKDGASTFRTFFRRLDRSTHTWDDAIALTEAGYDAVRPDLYVDPSNGRLHMVASSFTNATNIYYRASSSQGASWDTLQQVDINDPDYPECVGDTRYATVHAYGDQVWLVGRTMNESCNFFYCQYLYCTQTARSTDGGQSWLDANKEKLASWNAINTAEYGLSLAGVGDRLYLGYEVGSGSGGGLYFRRWNATNGTWGATYEQLETTGLWPTITQAADGQAWMMWQDNGSLKLRHYDGSNWDPAEPVLDASIYEKGFYPNLMLGTEGGRVEWVSTTCPGAPYRLVVDGRSVSADAPPVVSIEDPIEDQIVDGTYRVLVSASDDSALNSVALSIDGGSYQDITGNSDGTHYWYDWDTTAGYPDGAYTLQARATDNAAQTNESAVRNVIVDNVNDPPAADIVAPGDSSMVSGPITVQISANDAEDAAGSLSVEWWVDTGASDTATYNAGSGFYEADWDTALEDDGVHTLNARATDSQGSPTDASPVSVTTENVNAAPVAQIVAPSDSSTVVGTITVRISASDEEDAPEDLTVEWRIDSGSWLQATYNAATGYYDASWNTLGYSDGSHTVSAQATDSQSATTVADPVVVTVDNLDVPPNVVIVFPPNSGTVSGLVTVQISATDAEDAEGTLTVEWDVDGGGWQATIYNDTTTYYEATWDTSTASNGTHTFNAQAIDSALNTGSDSNSVTVENVNDPPVASFSYIATDLTADYTDASTDGDGTVVNWSWDFGDGNSSTAQNPSHTYAAAGTYNVSLTVTDDDGATDSTSQDVTVTAPNVPPTADFTYITTDLTADYTDASTDGDGTVVSWSWDFGDGNTSTAQNPSHTYASAGTYTVVLIVTDNEDAADQTSQDVTVQGGGAQTVHVGDLDGTKTSVRNTWTAAVTIEVHDGSHGLVNGATVNGEWSQGAGGLGECQTDGSGQCTIEKLGIPKKVSSVVFTVTGVNAAGATYEEADNHDPDGDSNGTQITVPPPANQAPVAAFTYACTDRTCHFDASDSYDLDGFIVAYAWAFGDGNTASGLLASHTYADDGSYPVDLTVTDDLSATGTDSQSVTAGAGGGDTMHVGGLLPGSIPGKTNRWNATVTITIHDHAHAPLLDATVTGTWSNGATGSAECTTDENGQCIIAKANLKVSVGSVTFTVTSLSHPTHSYSWEDNHDPDGEQPSVKVSAP